MKKILVAVDESRHSREAFNYILKKAKERDDHITILRVVPGIDYDLEGIEKILKGEIKNAKESIGELKKEAEKLGVSVDTEVITGENIATEIVKFAHEEGHDLIVVGARGKSDLGTIHLGSVAESVIRRARCPVLVVR